jgi:hypothetical protein
VNFGDPAAKHGLGVHFRCHVGEEEQLAITGARHEREFFALVHHLEARVAHPILPAHRFKVLLPALPVRRVGEHKIELLSGEGVVRKRGPFRAADNVVGALTLAFEQHVRLADGVGLGVNLLAVKQTLDLLVALRPDRRERLLPYGEHAAGAASAVIEQVGARLDLSLDGKEHEVRH